MSCKPSVLVLLTIVLTHAVVGLQEVVEELMALRGEGGGDEECKCS